MRFALVSLLGLLALAPDQDRAATADARGTLGVLRRDGVLVPFAAFDKDKWRAPWVADVGRRKPPATRDAIPDDWWGFAPPGAWRVRLMNGETVPFELGDPIVFQTFCARHLGMATTYASPLPLPPAPVEPYPKDGLAFTGNVPLEPIDVIAPSSREWAAMERTLADEVAQVEEHTIRQVLLNTQWRHPFPREKRREAPTRLESWYRTPSGKPGWTISYVELARTYPPRPEDKGCGLETLVSGWLHQENGALVDISGLRGKITYCDRVGATYMLPFASLQPKEKRYWIFQLSGWEDESYAVVEVRPKNVRYVIDVYAGGRRSCP